jgi:glycogen operon protein
MLLVSQGTPMLLGGDEIGRTQKGNNNAWCQDNELSWYDWDRARSFEDLRRFTQRLIRLRSQHPVFRRDTFLKGVDGERSGLPDVWWFRADGRKMTRRDWNDGEHVLGMFLNGLELPFPGPHGEQIEDDSFVVLINGHHEDRTFMLPRRRFGAQWTLELSTADPEADPGSTSYSARTEVETVSRSIVILKRVT